MRFLCALVADGRARVKPRSVPSSGTALWHKALLCASPFQLQSSLALILFCCKIFFYIVGEYTEHKIHTVTTLKRRL